MPDILVRRVPASIVSALKRRANRHGRSLQGEVVTILSAAAGSERSAAEIAARIRAKLLKNGRAFSDSARSLREDRER